MKPRWIYLVIVTINLMPRTSRAIDFAVQYDQESHAFAACQISSDSGSCGYGCFFGCYQHDATTGYIWCPTDKPDTKTSPPVLTPWQAAQPCVECRTDLHCNDDIVCTARHCPQRLDRV
ncbi:MAG: hypothetical protein ACI9OJ_001095 [Myxococcota bacterium]|jgi:hypothetical protein